MIIFIRAVISLIAGSTLMRKHGLLEIIVVSALIFCITGLILN